MADTTFVDKVTTLLTAWVQAVNNAVYRGANANYVTSTGSANAYVVTLPSSLYNAYGNGDTFTFKTNFANTGAATLQIVGASALTAYPIQYQGIALTTGDILNATVVTVTMMNNTWQLHDSNRIANTLNTITVPTLVVGPTSATANHFAQFDGTTGKLIKGGLALDTDSTLSANSDTNIASQKAVKTFALAVSTAAATASTGRMVFGAPAVQSPFVANAKTTTAHGLGSRPVDVIIYKECLTAEFGFSVGDRFYSTLDSGSLSDFGVAADATNVVILSNSGSITLINNTAPAGQIAGTAANWKIVALPYIVT